eukprot:CAMPEP_0194229666 /NCGR_PEP_ID=MMETSP0156-20130528/44010_1 /TAXON_ID=33649 /ORGANISM="Thalassionema nitzschioides, Strain L26-B" /LENGTH=1210 /DNA_ID=CAMNT_0038962225 /DNA_START=18 /DNA_END=3646 /DNA_ORIENTATION=+
MEGEQQQQEQPQQFCRREAEETNLPLTKKIFGRRGKNNCNQSPRKSKLFRLRRNNNKKDGTSNDAEDLSLLLQVIKERMKDDSFSLDEGDRNNLSTLMKEVLATTGENAKNSSFSSVSTSSSSSSRRDERLTQLANIVMALLVQEKNATDTGVPTVLLGEIEANNYSKNKNNTSDNDISVLLYPEHQVGEEEGGVEHTVEEFEERMERIVAILANSAEASKHYDTSLDETSYDHDQDVSREETALDTIMDSIAGLVPDALLFPNLAWDQAAKEGEDEKEEDSEDSFQLASEYGLSEVLALEEHNSSAYFSPTPKKKKKRSTSVPTSTNTQQATPEAPSCMDYLRIKEVEAIFCPTDNTATDANDDDTVSEVQTNIETGETMQSKIPGRMDSYLTNYFGVPNKEVDSVFRFGKEEGSSSHDAAEAEKNRLKRTNSKAETIEPCSIEVPPNGEVTVMNTENKNNGLMMPEDDENTIELCFIEVDVPSNGDFPVTEDDTKKNNNEQEELPWVMPENRIVVESSTIHTDTNQQRGGSSVEASLDYSNDAEIIRIVGEIFDSHDASFEYAREEFMEDLNGVLVDPTNNRIIEDSFEYSREEFIDGLKGFLDDQHYHNNELLMNCELPPADDGYEVKNENSALENISKTENKKGGDDFADTPLVDSAIDASFIYPNNKQKKQKQHRRTAVRGQRVGALVKHFHTWIRLQKRKKKGTMMMDKEQLNYSTDSSLWQGDTEQLFSTNESSAKAVGAATSTKSAKDFEISLFGPTEEGEEEDNKEDTLYAPEHDAVNFGKISILEPFEAMDNITYTDKSHSQFTKKESAFLRKSKGLIQKTKNGKKSLTLDKTQVVKEPLTKKEGNKNQVTKMVSGVEDEKDKSSESNTSLEWNGTKFVKKSSIVEELLQELDEEDDVLVLDAEDVITRNWTAQEEQRAQQESEQKTKRNTEEKEASRSSTDENTPPYQQQQNQEQQQQPRSPFRRNQSAHSIQETGDGVEEEVVMKEVKPHSATKRSAMSGAARTLIMDQENKQQQKSRINIVSPSSKIRNHITFSSRRRRSQRLAEVASTARSRRLSRLKKEHEQENAVTPKKSNKRRQSKSSPPHTSPPPQSHNELEKRRSEKQKQQHQQQSQPRPRSQFTSRLCSGKQSTTTNITNTTKNLTIEKTAWEPFKNAELHGMDFSSPTSVQDAAFSQFNNMPAASSHDNTGFDGETSFP